MQSSQAANVWRVLPLGTGRRLRNGRVALPAIRVRLHRSVTRQNVNLIDNAASRAILKLFRRRHPEQPRLTIGAVLFPPKTPPATCAPRAALQGLQPAPPPPDKPPQTLSPQSLIL